MTIEVKVSQVPGNIYNLALNDGATVADALNEAGLSNTEGFALTVNGESADKTRILINCDRIYLSRGAKGNCTR